MKKYIKSTRGNLVYEIERQNFTETFRTPENYFQHATRAAWFSVNAGFNVFVQYKGAFYMIDRTDTHGYITSIEFTSVTAEEAAAAKMERAAQAMSEAQEHEAKTAAAALDYDTETAEAEAREARFSADYAAALAKDAAELAAEAGTSNAASIADITAEYAERARRYATSAEETAEQNAAEAAERAEIIAAIEDPEERTYIEAEATANQWTPNETRTAIEYRAAITAANRAALALLDAYAETIGEHPDEDDDETRAARKIAAEAFGYLLPYPVTDEDRATVTAMVEAIAERWTQDHERRDLFSEQAEFEQYAAELAAVEAAAPEALESEGNPEDAVNLIAYTAFADIHDGAAPDTYDDSDMEQLERLMSYASEIVRRDGPAYGIQWAPYQRCELEAFLGEPDDYDVSAIEAEATEHDPKTGRTVWTPEAVHDLWSICERHELFSYAPAI